MKIRVGVIFGGETVEHEVSIISAIQAMNKMDLEKYEVVPIYITKDREWYTGEMLKEIESYQDFGLIKKYCAIHTYDLTLSWKKIILINKTDFISFLLFYR